MANDFAIKLAELQAQSKQNRFGTIQTPYMNVPRGPDVGSFKETKPSPIGEGVAKGIEKVGDLFMEYYAKPKLQENTPQGKRTMAITMFNNYWSATPESRAEMEKNPGFQNLLAKVQEEAPALVKKRPDGTYSFYEPIPTEIQMRQQTLYDAGRVSNPPMSNLPTQEQVAQHIQGYPDSNMSGMTPGQMEQFFASANQPQAGAGTETPGGSSGMENANTATGVMALIKGIQSMSGANKPPAGPTPLPKQPAGNAYTQIPTNMPGQQQKGELPLNRNEILFAKEIEAVKRADAAKVEADLKQKEFDALSNPKSPQARELEAKIRYYNGLAAHHAQSGALMKEQRLIEKDENTFENKVLKDVGDQITKVRTTAMGRPTRGDQTAINGHYLRGIADLNTKFPTIANNLASQMLAETHSFYTNPKAINDVTEGQIATDLHQVRRAIAAAPGIGLDKEGKKMLNPEDVDYYCRILDAVYNSQHRHLLSDNEVSIVKSFQEQRSKRMMR